MMSKELRRGEDCEDFDSCPEPLITPRPGEVWNVYLPQTCKAGHEIYGVRRSIVVSDNHSHGYKLRLVVPLTGFQTAHGASPLATILSPDPQNGLDKASTAWAFHART